MGDFMGFIWFYGIDSWVWYLKMMRTMLMESRPFHPPVENYHPSAINWFNIEGHFIGWGIIENHDLFWGCRTKVVMGVMHILWNHGKNHEIVTDRAYVDHKWRGVSSHGGEQYEYLFLWLWDIVVPYHCTHAILFRSEIWWVLNRFLKRSNLQPQLRRKSPNIFYGLCLKMAYPLVN